MGRPGYCAGAVLGGDLVVRDSFDWLGLHFEVEYDGAGVGAMAEVQGSRSAAPDLARAVGLCVLSLAGDPELLVVALRQAEQHKQALQQIQADV